MKELVDGVEYQDGVPVLRYKGRFSGTWETEQEDGAALSNGELVAFVVVGRAASPKFDTDKKSSQLVRQNTFKIEEVIQLTIDRAEFLLDQIGKKVHGINEGLVETKQEPQNETFAFDTFTGEPVDFGAVMPVELLEPETKTVYTGGWGETVEVDINANSTV